jgi:hypothetical protein
MKSNIILHSGWITGASFIIGSLLLGSLLPDYSHVSQTVSEIGERGSPLMMPWHLFSVSIGLLMILFASGIILFAKQNKLSILPGIFMLFYGISQFGIGFYPSPHSLHNVFGLSMTIGYFAPLVFALSWKNKLGKGFKNISILTFILIILGIFLNLTPAFAPTLYPLEYYGIVQRFLLFTFYAYSGYVSVRCVGY